jgi:hypothetical protein
MNTTGIPRVGVSGWVGGWVSGWVGGWVSTGCNVEQTQTQTQTHAPHTRTRAHTQTCKRKAQQGTAHTHGTNVRAARKRACVRGNHVQVLLVEHLRHDEISRRVCNREQAKRRHERDEQRGQIKRANHSRLNENQSHRVSVENLSRAWESTDDLRLLDLELEVVKKPRDVRVPGAAQGVVAHTARGSVSEAE